MSVEDLVVAIEGRLLWVACAEGSTVVGFVATEVFADSLHIAELDVLPDYGRQGVGAALLKQVWLQAEKSDMHWITLTTFDNLPWNAPFYQKHGFAVPDSLELFPHLQNILEAERRSGLQHRVAMAKRSPDYPMRRKDGKPGAA